MLSILNKTKFAPNFKPEELNVLFAKLEKLYRLDEISSDRKDYLSKTINKFGYLPYPQYKVLEELSDSEAIYSLIEKLKYEKVYVDNKFISFQNPSVLKRRNIKNSSWFKHEGHNIKLLSLSALGKDSNKTGSFLDWVKCLITLDNGSIENGVLPATLYLIPFCLREFECAYLPKSNEVSYKLQDDNLVKFLGLDVEHQVKLFIEIAQLAGHPVIYDVLPQTARFSKMVLLKPEIARWLDVKEITNSILGYLSAICSNLAKSGRFDEKDIINTQKIYIENLKGNSKRYSLKEQKIFHEIENQIKEYKISVSYNMSFEKKQQELTKRVREILSRIIGNATSEKEITKQDEAVRELIKEGLWTFPGGAWCSSGVPIFDKMSKDKKYPIFKHYNNKAEDVTNFANLDCQTPFYFYHFELNKFNNDVVDYFVNYTKNLQKEFNFDGFRIDHIDHIVDEVSQDKKGHPISYRAPYKVLGKMNSEIKKTVPYFATLAEYMLWDGYFKEYHKDMNFDLLWGDDIVSQSSKTPEQIINDNMRLSCYNQKNGRLNPLSILKGYNNQDGEFREINQYPAQLGPEGALFKWFKYKFLPGGKFASRPTLLIDGDESYTKGGIERIISKEVSMVRNNDWGFFEKFNALNYFVQNDKLINNGKSVLYVQENNGFAAWEIVADAKENAQYSYLVVANYFAPSEIKDVVDEFGNSEKKNVRGKITRNNTVKLKNGKELVSYFDFDYDDMKKCLFVEKPLSNNISNEITFNELHPGEFRVYKMISK